MKQNTTHCIKYVCEQIIFRNQIWYHFTLLLYCFTLLTFSVRKTHRARQNVSLFTHSFTWVPRVRVLFVQKQSSRGPVHQKGGTARVKFAFYTCASMCEDVLEHKRATQDAKRSLRLDGETQCTQIICMLRVSTSTTEQPYADYLHNSEAIVKTTGWFVRC